MALALDQCTGALVPVGFSMGGYGPREWHASPLKGLAGMALLSTNAGVDGEELANDRRRNQLATHRGFRGIAESFYQN